MIKTNLPDLTKWHPLPAGGVILSGERYAELNADGSILITVAGDDYRPDDCENYYTENPMTLPLVPLPTKVGNRIIARLRGHRVDEHHLLTLGTSGFWLWIDGSSEPDPVPTEDIEEWMPVGDWRRTR